MIRPIVVAVAGAAVVILAFLVIPGGGASLVVFELLLVAIAGATMRRTAPPDFSVDGPAAPRSRRGRGVPDFPALPRNLRRVERLVRYGRTHAHSAGTRLVPLLRELAEDGLMAHHRCDIHSDPAHARALLGTDAWALVRPDWEETTNPSGPGPSLDQITAVVIALERLEAGP